MRPTLFLSFSLALFAVAAALTAAPARADAPEVIQCHGNDMTVHHDDADLHFVGPCGTIRIVGDDAAITVDAAEAIVIDGDDAHVRSADDLDVLTIEGDRADVDVADVEMIVIDGDGNRVAADAVDRLDIDGDDNHVTWVGPQPATEIAGQRNIARHH